LPLLALSNTILISRHLPLAVHSLVSSSHNDYVKETKGLFFHQGSFYIGRTGWVLGFSWCFYFKLDASAQSFLKLHIRLTSDAIACHTDIIHWEKSRENFGKILYFSRNFPIFSQNGRIIHPFWEKNGKISGKITNFPMIFPSVRISQYLPLAVHW